MTQAEQKDLILNYLNKSKNRNKVESISSMVNDLGIEKQRIEMLCSLISKDENIVYTTGPDGACKMKHNGTAFLEQGGYAHVERMHTLATVKSQTKEDLEIQQLQSLIATNQATKNAYDIQKKQNRTSIRLVGAATIISLATLIKELLPQQPIIDRETKQLLQKQVQSQEHFQQSIQRIDSTFQIVADSLKN